MPEIAAIHFEGVENVTKRKAAQGMREAFRRTAVYHVDHTLGDHFRKNAKTMPGGPYGFIPRPAKYNAEKLRRFGTDEPNVRTGRMRRFIRNNARITATQYRARIYLRNYFPMNDDRRREMEVIAPSERREMGPRAKQYFLEFVATNRRRRFRRKIA